MKTEIDNINDAFKQNKSGKFKDGLGNIFYLYNGISHGEDGPSDIWIDGYEEYYYYGIKPKNINQFYDLTWRRKIEIKKFL